VQPVQHLALTAKIGEFARQEHAISLPGDPRLDAFAPCLLWPSHAIPS
jgi:hypothetical protein